MRRSVLEEEFSDNDFSLLICKASSTKMFLAYLALIVHNKAHWARVVLSNKQKIGGIEASVAFTLIS